MKQQKLIIATAVLVLAVTLVFVGDGGGSDEAGPVAPTVEASGDYVVTLGEDGYDPAELTIKKGETVTFVTTNDRFFWPASNIHPTHKIYAEFDPREPIASEDTWSFTFERAGVWHYHDHLAPYFTGVVMVAE